MAREAAIFQEITRGNVPPFLRAFAGRYAGLVASGPALAMVIA